VEVKAGAGFHSFTNEGRAVSQADWYASALAAEPDGAQVRRVGTLTRVPTEEAATAHHDLRARDVSWAEVRRLLAGVDTRAPGGEAAADLVEAIDLRADPKRRARDDPEVARALQWGHALLERALPALARACRGAVTSGPGGGQKEVYIGGYLRVHTTDAAVLAPWLVVAPAATGYSVPGEPDAVWLLPRPEGGLPPAVRLEGDFQRSTDLAGYRDWRASIARAEVEAAEDLDAQAGLVTEWASDLLAAAGLVAAHPVAGDGA